MYCQFFPDDSSHTVVAQNIAPVYFWDAQFPTICWHEHPDPERPAAAGCQQWQQFPFHDHDAIHEHWGIGWDTD